MCKSGSTSSFSVKVGLHQGLALSFFLFGTIIGCLTNEVQRETPWDMLSADHVVHCGKINNEVEGRLKCGDVQWKIAE